MKPLFSGGLSVGVPKKGQSSGDVQPLSIATTSTTTSKGPGKSKAEVSHKSDDIPPKPAKKLKLLEQETEETRQLSTQDLQRLVLLEQLKLARMQQQHVAAKLSSDN